MRFIDFSTWQGVLTTLAGLAMFTLIGVGIRVLMMLTIQQRQQRMNRQINERLKTLISAYKVLGGSFTGRLSVDPTHLGHRRAQERLASPPEPMTGAEAGAVLVAALVSGGYSAPETEAAAAADAQPAPEGTAAPTAQALDAPDSGPSPAEIAAAAIGQPAPPDGAAGEAPIGGEGPPAFVLERRAQMRDAVEAALSDILLLGTEEQVRLAGKAAADLAEGRVIQTADLVVALRAYIRKALDLEPIPTDVTIPAQGPTRPASGGRAGGRGGERGGGSGGGVGGGGGGAAGGGGGMGMGMGMGMGAGRRSGEPEV